MSTPEAPTNPFGRCFISYRRSRLDEVRRLVSALHDHGIPTWQDLTDLDEEPLEPALRAAIADTDRTAAGILWITPELAGRPIITGIEIPELMARAERGGAFYLVPVAAGGLDYATAAREASGTTTLSDLETWSIAQINEDPASDGDVVKVAGRVLSRRLRAIDSNLPPGAPLVVDVFTRDAVAHRADAALTVDLTHRFDGRLAHAGAWQAHILAAFRGIVQAVVRRAPGRPLCLRGQIGLPTAVALGATMLAPSGVSAVWMQLPAGGGPREPYGLGVERRPSGFTVSLRDQLPSAKDLAVLVNVNADSAQAIRATEGLPKFRGHVVANPPGGLPHTFSNAGEAVDLAHALVGQTRAARARYGNRGHVHLFIAGPAGLAFLVGQLMNTLGPVHTYEHISDDATGHYRHAVTLRPSE